MKGLKPLPYDARDYDLHKTFGATAAPSFPESYSVENGLWCPDQNVGGEVFNLPPLPFGCTDYAQADVCADDDQELKNPIHMENFTHANARGGIDLRESVAAATQVFNRTAYFRITPTAPLDFFDAVRLAMLSTRDEGRSVSVGTPWYSEWSVPLRFGILPLPPSFNVAGLGWHNWKVAGWETMGGAPYLICKMWAGPDYGDHGFVYMSRELFNAVMNINGSAAYTLTKVKPTDVQTIDFDFVKWVVSYIRWLFKVDQTPSVPALPPSGPQDAPKPAQPTAPTVPTVPPAPTASLEAFCLAIREYEGWYSGSRSWRNNNPGNCRYSSVGYAAVYEPVLKDKDNFAVFKDYATGWLYLKNLVKAKISANPQQSIAAFFEVYAPAGDHNDPQRYAQVVAQACGMQPTDPVSGIL